MVFFRRICFLLVFVNCCSILAVEVNPYMVDMPRDGQQIDGVWLSIPVSSKPTDLQSPAEYVVEVENTNDKSVEVSLEVEHSSKNVGVSRLSKDKVLIPAGKTENVILSVTLTDSIPIGSFESASVFMQYNGRTTNPLQVSTVRLRAHPYILVKNEDIKDILDKVEKYDWAAKGLENLINLSSNLKFSGLNYPRMSRQGYSWKGLTSRKIEDFWQGALAYAITCEQNGRDKAIEMLKAVACPQTGYATTLWATHSTAYVHEGEFFTLYAAIYDLLYNEPQLTAKDHQNIENTLRLFLDVAKQWHYEGDIGNWVTVPNAAALIVSLVLQDVESYQYFIHCDKGFDQQLSYGIMGDGWWLEGASNYNYVVAHWYGYAAKASDNWGFNLFDRRVPAKYQSNEGRRWKNGWLSMNFDVWGPPGGSYRSLKQLYDGVIILMDENGHTVANNDSRKMEPGNLFELGYNYFNEPAYAWVMSNVDRIGWDSLVYGKQLPDNLQDPRNHSGYVGNVGVTALRNPVSNPKSGDQIEAYLKWGTHGGWHGHFDRTNLLALRRNGKDLFFSQPSWFGYGSNMYKAWVQPSISHNMVIVDEFQQEPVESEQLLFFAGENIQVSAVETKARWQEKLSWDISDPGDLDPENMDKMVDYGQNEPVLQRRLLALTEHYLVVVDYLQGRQEHTFDWLLHPVGFIETIGNVNHIGYSQRLKNNPASSYYYITGCDTYSLSGRHILNRFKDENLNLDVHTFLNEPAEMKIGTFPYHLCRQPVKIFKDGQEVFSEVIGIDSCGEYEIDIDIDGAKELELRFARRTHSAAAKPGDYMALAMPQIIMPNGKIDLSLSDYAVEGAKASVYGKDYEGNDIVIAGKEHKNAFMIEPQGAETIVKIKLQDMAKSFNAIIGAVKRADWHSNERKTLCFRTNGTSTKRISILEPYENSAQIKSVRLLPNDTLSIQLASGITHEIRVNEIATAPKDDISVSFAMLKDGRVISTEKAENNNKRLIYKDDFDQSLANWHIEQMHGGSVQIKNGFLEIDDAAGCTVWFKEKLTSPVSIEYDVIVVDEGGANDRVSDLNCFWMAQDPGYPDNIFARSAQRGGSFANYNPLRLYYVGYAANHNTTTRFRRYAGDGTKPLLPEHDLTGYKMTGGEKLQVKIISDGSVNQYWINGEKIFDFNDPEPFTDGYFGFRTVKNRMRISNFRIYQLSN